MKAWLQMLIFQSANGPEILWICLSLSFLGTVSAAYPVTAVVVPATLMAPKRLWQITAVSSFGSAVGATILVLVFHHLGWSQIYQHFPELNSNAKWMQVIDWVSAYGAFSLFLIAVSPLPQTPALIFFGIARHDYLIVFLAILAGKLLKYGVFTWLTSYFPERFRR